MQYASVAFIAQCKAATNHPRAYIEVSWDGLGTFLDARAATHWVNETRYARSHNGRLRLSEPGEELVAPGTVGQATVVLSNDTGRFSWQNPSCPLASYISTAVGLTGKLIRIWQGFAVSGVETGSETIEYVCIFSGVIVSWTPSTQEATVTIECRDRSYIYLQDKRNTVLVEDQRPDEWITYLANMISLSSGEMILDPGIFAIPWCWLDDESIAEQMWEAARADNGSCYFDQMGTLHFESILHWMGSPHNVVQWSFTERDYQQPDPTNAIDDVATQIVAEWAAREPQTQTIIYSLDRVKVIPPGGSVTWTARFSWPVLTIATPVAQLINNVDNKNDHSDDIEGDYAANSSGGAILTGNITIAFTEVYAQQCKITISNSHTLFAAHLVYLQLQGIALSGRPAEQVTQDASPKPYDFERIRSVRGNVYVQTEQQAKAFIGYLSAKHSRLRTVNTLRSVSGIPQLEMGDRIEHQDHRSQGVGGQRQAFTIGIDWTATPDAGYWQDLTVLDVDGLWEYDDYFIIGVTALGHHGRCWF